MSIKTILTIVVGSVIIAVFAALLIGNVVETNEKLKFKDIELKSRSLELNQLDAEYDRLNQELIKAREDKNTSEEQLQKLDAEKQQLETKSKELEAQLQAKIESETAPRVASASTSRSYSLDELKSIVTQAALNNGLDPEWFWNLAKCESTWNPNAVNTGYYDNGHPSGLFQHISGYWGARAAKHGYAGASVFDPVANANVTAAMWKSGSHLWECQ